MPLLPPEVYLPIGTALAAGIAVLFSTVLAAKKAHLKDLRELSREQAQAAKETAAVLERLEVLLERPRRG